MNEAAESAYILEVELTGVTDRLYVGGKSLQEFDMSRAVDYGTITDMRKTGRETVLEANPDFAVEHVTEKS